MERKIEFESKLASLALLASKLEMQNWVSDKKWDWSVYIKSDANQIFVVLVTVAMLNRLILASYDASRVSHPLDKVN